MMAVKKDLFRLFATLAPSRRGVVIAAATLPLLVAWTPLPGIEEHPRFGAPTAAETASPALEIEDLVRLLEADVGSGLIVRQIHRAGIAFSADVDALVRLKEAGADERVLAAILDADDGPRPATADRRTVRELSLPATVEGGGDAVTSDDLRIYRGRDTDGKTVVVLTNLDENGRRIGGEVRHPARPNIVSSPAWSDFNAPRPRPEYAAGPEADGSPPREQPAVVIIREPAPAPPPARESCATSCGGCAYGGTGCNVVGYGGVVGGYRYPEKLWFLGYGPSSTPVSPSFGAVPAKIGPGRHGAPAPRHSRPAPRHFSPGPRRR
jgi:hypothetical protein